MSAFDGKGGLVHLDDVPAEEVAGEPRLPHAVQDLGAAAGATVAAARRVHLAGDALVPAFATLAGPAPAEEFALSWPGAGGSSCRGPTGRRRAAGPCGPASWCCGGAGTRPRPTAPTRTASTSCSWARMSRPSRPSTGPWPSPRSST